MFIACGSAWRADPRLVQAQVTASTHQHALYITVFQNQVPNSKGRAVIHSEELPPESQANYRPSHRPITARVTDQLPPARRGPRSGQPGSPAIIPDLAD